MTYHDYQHKKYDNVDHRSGDKWRAVNTLGRLRRPLLVALLCVLTLVYWQVSIHSRLFEQQAPGQDTDLRPKKGLRFPHDAPRDRIYEESKVQAQEDRKEVHLPLPEAVRQEGQNHDRQGGVSQADDTHYFHSHDDDEDSDEHEEVRGKKEKPREMKSDDDDEKGNAAKKVELQTEHAEHMEDLPRGPVEVKPELDPQREAAGLLSSPDGPQRQKVIEAESEEHLTVEETGDNLPEIVHVTFEEAVQNTVLAGWEDEWIAHANYDARKWGKLKEPKIDFVYLWVNGSEEAFQQTKRPYEEKSVLNDPAGEWINSHGTNRYRDWDELRYTVRSVERYAKSFRNKIQILVNSVVGTETGKQVPTWLDMSKPVTNDVVQVLSQEQFFDGEKHVCLPTFNSLTIENQLFNTPSTTDHMYALSDDMILTKEHSASDIVSPLFGPVMGFKTNAYNTMHPPTENDAARFGEKPFLIYTSWLLNRRFGERKRKGQGHFGHSLSRTVMREAIGSFPGPELQSACKRFRGEPGFQLYSWFVTFHYLIERHREAMLWSLIMIKSDLDSDGHLSWDERLVLLKELERGMENEGKVSYRKRNFYHVAQRLERAGIEPPKVHTDHTWTSLDGPSSFINLDCSEFDINDCLAPGFSISKTDAKYRNPIFSSSVIFERLARTKPQCGDCLLKLLLNTVPTGLSPVLPDANTHPDERKLVVKALMRYRYVIADTNAQFVMITDAEQIDATLTTKYVRNKKEPPGQLCLNDDVTTEDEDELDTIQTAMNELYLGLLPEKSPFEI